MPEKGYQYVARDLMPHAMVALTIAQLQSWASLFAIARSYDSHKAHLMFVDMTPFCEFTELQTCDSPKEPREFRQEPTTITPIIIECP